MSATSFKHHIRPRTWDGIIALLLIFSACTVMLSLGMFRHASGYAALFWLSSGVIFGCGFLLTAYGSFVEPQRLTVKNVRVALPVMLPVSIAIASDFHVGPYKGAAYMRRVVDKLLALEPDVILLPGDFLFDETAEMELLRPLALLRAPLGVFAVSGNHDAGNYLTRDKRPFHVQDRVPELAKFLRGLGITVLRNEHVVLSRDGVPLLTLAGIDELWMPESDLDRAYEGASSELPLLLLSHQPEVILDTRSAQADLIVSGHTHGGQVRLPFIGPLAGMPSKLGRAYDRGLFTLQNGTRLFITQGAGESLVRARLFCPPEIVFFEISAPT